MTIKLDADTSQSMRSGLHKAFIKSVVSRFWSLLKYKETAEIQQIETVIEKEVIILKTWQKVLMWLGALAILWILIKILLKIQFSV